MTVISLPKILRDRLTDEDADAFVQILDKVEARSQQATLEIAEERFERKLAEAKAELIKWMFISWVGQVATITSILFAFFRK